MGRAVWNAVVFPSAVVLPSKVHGSDSVLAELLFPPQFSHEHAPRLAPAFTPPSPLRPPSSDRCAHAVCVTVSDHAQALRHSLGQMEQRMMSGRHTRPNTTITTDPNRYSRKKSSMDHYDNHHHSSYHHRRTRSALPISRADAAARAIAIARGVLPDEDGRDEARRCGDSGINPPSSFWKSTPTAVDGFDTFNSSPCGGVRGGITEQEEREGFGGLEGDACPADSAPAPVAVSSQKLPADGAHEGGVDQAPVCDDGVDDDDDDDLMFEFDDLTM